MRSFLREARDFFGPILYTVALYALRGFAMAVFFGLFWLGTDFFLHWLGRHWPAGEGEGVPSPYWVLLAMVSFSVTKRAYRRWVKLWEDIEKAKATGPQ